MAQVSHLRDLGYTTVSNTATVTASAFGKEEGGIEFLEFTQPMLNVAATSMMSQFSGPMSKFTPGASLHKQIPV